MSTDATNQTTDLIRWTFTVPVAAVEPVQTYLVDHGAEVFSRGETCHVLWEETEIDLDAVVEAIWELAGLHFEITQEEFHRLEIHVLHPDEEEADGAEAAETEFHPEVDSLEIREL